MNKGIVKQVRYTKRGKNFCVEAVVTSRSGLAKYNIRSEMAWCLYVIIFKDHPLYNKASNNQADYDTYLGDQIYDSWHGGCTYYHKNSDYVKIGCDYQHLGDERFCQSNSTDMDPEIENDFNNLYEFFANACDNEE